MSFSDTGLSLFSRQMLLPTVGVEGQERLLNATVLIVGAGGLGCTVAQYLHGSGVGELVIVDDDVVALSNLPRQVLFTEEDLGQPKAEALVQVLQSRFSGGHCVAVKQHLTVESYAELAKKYRFDVLIDAGDNLALTWLLGQLAKENTLPLVHAAVSRFEGHLYSYLPQPNFPAVTQLFPRQSETETCSQTGVMTVSVGVVASLQALQVVRLLLQPDLGEIKPELLLFDGATVRLMPVTLQTVKS